jgi:hypothetical protein
MPILERFLAYAQDFEQTYVDDDWSRLTQYFAPDATYEVLGTSPCTLKGPQAIFRGMKKSLDNFDRKFKERRIEVAAPPKVEGDTLMMEWLVTYERPGAPPLPLRGRSVARYQGDAIVRLTDTLHADDVTMSWFAKHGAGLDPSYV